MAFLQVPMSPLLLFPSFLPSSSPCWRGRWWLSGCQAKPAVGHGPSPASAGSSPSKVRELAALLWCGLVCSDAADTDHDSPGWKVIPAMEVSPGECSSHAWARGPAVFRAHCCRADRFPRRLHHGDRGILRMWWGRWSWNLCG